MSEFRWHTMEDAPRDGTAILLLLEKPYKQAVGLGPAPAVRVVLGDLFGDGNTIMAPDGMPVRVIRWAPIPPYPADDLPESLGDLDPAKEKAPSGEPEA